MPIYSAPIQTTLSDTDVGLNARALPYLKTAVSSYTYDQGHGAAVRILGPLLDYTLANGNHIRDYIQEVVWDEGWFYFHALLDMTTGLPIPASLWTNQELGNYNTLFSQNNQFSTEPITNSDFTPVFSTPGGGTPAEIEYDIETGRIDGWVDGVNNFESDPDGGPS